MKEGDDIEVVIDSVTVSELLVATISLVFGVTEDGDFEIASVIFVLQSCREGGILGGVVNDQNFYPRPPQFRGDAIEDIVDRFLGIVSNDENEDAFLGVIDHEFRW